MAKIVADGETRRFGKQHIEITGTPDGNVDEIRCKDDVFGQYVGYAIAQGYGAMANNYHPERGTMLQAFAAMTTLFLDYDDVKVDGDIGTIEQSGGPDVIY